MGADVRAECLARHQLHWTFKLIFQKKPPSPSSFFDLKGEVGCVDDEKETALPCPVEDTPEVSTETGQRDTHNVSLTFDSPILHILGRTHGQLIGLSSLK